MKATIAFCCLFALRLCGQPADSNPTPFSELRANFLEGVDQLELPGFRIAYVDNLTAIAASKGIEQQRDFFREIESRLETVATHELSSEDLLDYRLIQYECEMNRQRLELESAWDEERPNPIPTGGLMNVANGKAWYRYFLKRWIDLEVEPDALYAFGLEEIRRVKAAMREIESRYGLDSAAFNQQLQEPDGYYYSAAEVQAACEAIHARLQRTLPRFFPAVEKIPELAIAPGTDERLARVPGFYNNSTFYYNFFDRPFERRQIGWLYVHEGLPGHHYERHYTRRFSRPSAVARRFNYSAYVEGWGAYVEDVGGVYGAYPTAYDEYGKWEWDLIRSLRVCMDVGLNYYGWSDGVALSFWQRYSTGHDDIARREIDRMKRWPAQVITYKYGAARFRRWREKAAKDPDFDWKDFHASVLERGPLPLSLLAEELEME